MGATPMARRADDESDHGDHDGSLAPVVPLPSSAPTDVDFDRFYRRELPAIVAVVAAVSGHQQAEEIAQEALLRAHRDWSRIQRYDKPGAWVRRVALNLASSSVGAAPRRLVPSPSWPVAVSYPPLRPRWTASGCWFDSCRPARRRR